LQLAAARTVKHLPAAGAQSLADAVRRGEVAFAPAGDTLGKQGFGLCAVR
jgi:hypothetical protein